MTGHSESSKLDIFILQTLPVERRERVRMSQMKLDLRLIIGVTLLGQLFEYKHVIRGGPAASKADCTRGERKRGQEVKHHTHTLSLRREVDKGVQESESNL